MNEVIIVIPIYKETPDKFERICLNRCVSILPQYPKALVFPEGLDISAYINILGENIYFHPFSERFFRSIASYNSLLTSISFYRTFIQYKFLLIYQPDAYVFRDELELWCKKGYDYIGAPIYEYDGTITPKIYLGAGNGGFSLRNIQTAIRVLETFKKVFTFDDLLKWLLKYNWKGRLRYLPYFLQMSIGLGGNSHYLLNYSKLNEDVFWGVYVPKAFEDYKVATFEESYKFAMEYNCEVLLKMNNHQLPFGTHQWYKRDFLSFWSKYIQY